MMISHYADVQSGVLMHNCTSIICPEVLARYLNDDLMISHYADVQSGVHMQKHYLSGSSCEIS